MIQSLEDLDNVRGTILLLGETGVGKSYSARLLHERCKRTAPHPFAVVNLSSLSDSLLESELFGHRRGAFTNAFYEKIGYAGAVGQGTLFLDEIGDISLSAQLKLLRLIDEQLYVPVGDCRDRPFHGRIIAATHRNLADLVAQGKFREDLYHRLNIFSYRIPPLRERPDQLRILMEQLLSQACQELDRSPLILSARAQSLLQSYRWPGNIREMKNCMHYLATLVRGEEVTEAHLPHWSGARTPEVETIEASRAMVYPLEYTQALAQFERNYFTYIFHKFGGQINQTARSIALSKVTLIAKARKYGINTMLIKSQGRQRTALLEDT